MSFDLVARARAVRHLAIEGAEAAPVPGAAFADLDDQRLVVRQPLDLVRREVRQAVADQLERGGLGEEPHESTADEGEPVGQRRAVPDLDLRPCHLSEGESIDQIATRIRGTRKLQYADGILNRSRTDIEAVVRDKAFKGAEILYTLELPTGTRLLSLFPSHYDHHLGDTVRVRMDAEHLICFPG